jgi:chemotaxis protein methyltransferase CheR
MVISMKNNLMLCDDNLEIEIHLLLEAIYYKYGHDFRSYSRAHIKRRLLRRLILSKLNNLEEMIWKLLNDRDFFHLILMDFSINVTEMFRDPSFYRVVRAEVVPVLGTYSFYNIWIAGCSTGEEAYSVAILLKEEGFYDRAQIYATDFNETILQQAKEGVYSNSLIEDYQHNYRLSGGDSDFNNYYNIKYDYAIMDQSLKKNLIFADHNLVTDGVFGEMNVIICRNVLIYFNRELQNRVLKLFYDSLCNGGILCLGSKESLRFTTYEDKFITINEKERIYQKKFI